eukprot:COSAG06_NODE_1183_length_10357_cov_17.781244_4_plen_558_part_00
MAQPEPEPEPEPLGRLIDLVPEGDGPCIVDGVVDSADPSQQRRPLTHSGLREFVAQRFQREAARCGVPHGARVCVALPSGPESATALFAFTSRGCYAPLSDRHTALELSAELAELRPSALVVEAGATAAPPAAAAAALGIRVVELVPDKETSGLFTLQASPGAGEAPTGCEHPATATRSGQAVAMLLQTSGTTRRPKTVALTHAGLSWGARRVADTLHLTPSDVCVNPMPLHHLHGIAVSLLASVIAGAAVVCPRGSVDGRHLLRCLREHQASWYSATPTHHLALLQAVQAEQPSQQKLQAGADPPALAIGVRGLERLRFIRNCSAALAAPLARRLRDTFRTTVLPSYAMTECLPIASHPLPLPGASPAAGAGGPAAAAAGDGSREEDDRLGSVGMAAGAEIVIMSVLADKQQQQETAATVGKDCSSGGGGGGGGARETAVVGVGVVGEVAVRGPCLMPGYLTVTTPPAVSAAAAAAGGDDGSINAVATHEAISSIDSDSGLEVVSDMIHDGEFKRLFLSHLYIETIILPRQARDKHRESTQKQNVFPQGMGMSIAG